MASTHVAKKDKLWTCSIEITDNGQSEGLQKYWQEEYLAVEPQIVILHLAAW